MRPEVDVYIDEEEGVVEGDVVAHTIVVGPNDSPYDIKRPKEEKWKLYMQDSQLTRVKMGDFITPFVSSSIKATSPSGTYLGFKHELQISVDFNADADRNFYIFPERIQNQ